MSGRSPKKTTFITEGSNPNDQQQQQQQGAQAAEGQQQPTDQPQTEPQPEANLEDDRETGTPQSDENDNENEDDLEEEEEASEDDYVEYVNPFYPQYTQPTDSDKEKNQSSENADEDDEDPSNIDVRPISAMAPKVTQQDDTQVEISSTPAFQCLEELFQSGKLTGTQVAQLKAKYIELHMTLKKSRENEARLLKESKDCLKKIDENNEILQKADAFPDNLTNEVLKLRVQYLKCENDAACSDERLFNLDYKKRGLEDDKEMLEREYARMPKPQELEREIEHLKSQNSELSREITLRKAEISDLKLTIGEKNAYYENQKREYRDLLDTVESRKNDYVQVNLLPNQLMKECDKIATETDEVNKEKARIELDIKNMTNKLAEVEATLKDLEDKNEELLEHINQEKMTQFEREKDFSDLSKQYELEKEKEIVLQGDKDALETSLNHAIEEKKAAFDMFHKVTREKEKDSKTVKKLELQLKATQDSMSNLKLQYEKLEAKRDQEPPEERVHREKEYKKLFKEVEELKRNLMKQQEDMLNKKVDVEKRIEKEEELLCQQSDFRIEAVEITRLAAIKQDEREQKSREALKAEVRYKRVLEDIKTKETTIEEHKKNLSDLKIKLNDSAKKYEVVKSERNKCLNKIQVCTQKVSEMREKIKILSNEMEILRTSSTAKEKLLQKQRLKFANATSLRDSIKNEVAKQKIIVEDMHETSKVLEKNIERCNNIISYKEQQAIKLTKKYEQSIAERNEFGVKLITRSDEVCIVCEKTNAQENLLKNANIELQAREEEIRFHLVKIQEEARLVDLYKKQCKHEVSKKKELESLREQLVDCQNYLIKLEKKVEDCNDPSRIRLLDKGEENLADLMKKLEELEIKLSKVEEQCLEKELILEQVNRLAERLSNKLDTSKDDTLNLAKKVNQIQSQIKDTTKKMMAAVSELSIAQATALKLQEEVKSKEILLEQSYNRMDKGEAPSADIEREWLRTLEIDEKVKERQQVRHQEDKVIYEMQNGYFTTAEARPTAYIPQNETELPLPKPYGRHAPFKPQEPGSTMRHIKKPNPKPIEI